MKNLIICALIATTFLSCGDNKKSNSKKDAPDSEITSDNYNDLNTLARNVFGVLPVIAELPGNTITEEQVQLGKTLYFDKRLSKDNTQSCNTCHNLDTYGVDNKSFSEGNDGGLGGRNSPTTFNAALHITQFWDGREPDVEAQAGGPILNPDEMAMPSEKAVIDRLSGIKEYKVLFSKAFPGEEKPITYNNLKRAIGAFERKLITPSKFDEYIAGNDDALNDKEKRGLQTYLDSGCTTCHSGELLGGNMYQKFGLFSDYWEHTKSKNIDNGRFDLTDNQSDKYMFKVPSLRNIEKTAPYFHDGSVSDLNDAIRIMAKTQVNKDLTDIQISEIQDFLATLTADVPGELKNENL
jgi:cytochrome c peroxidase